MSLCLAPEIIYNKGSWNYFFIDIMRLRILSLMLGSQGDENMLLEIVGFVTITIVF